MLLVYDEGTSLKTDFLTVTYLDRAVCNTAESPVCFSQPR